MGAIFSRVSHVLVHRLPGAHSLLKTKLQVLSTHNVLDSEPLALRVFTEHLGFYVTSRANQCQIVSEPLFLQDLVMPCRRPLTPKFVAILSLLSCVMINQ